MADKGWEWDIAYSNLDYVAQHASEIRAYSLAIGAGDVVALGVAGSIAREETANESIYPYSLKRFGFLYSLEKWREKRFLSGYTHEQLAGLASNWGRK